MAGNRKSRERWLASEHKRELMITMAQTGKPISDIIADPQIGWSRSNYEKHRDRHPDWAAKLTAEHQKARYALKKFDGSFASFRLQYLDMATTWFQERMIEAIESAKPGEVTMILIPPGHGKGLALATPLPTPDGWTTAGDVEVGDRLIGSDGRPTTVTFTSDPHDIDCYEVSFGDGSSLVVDGDHRWTVRRRDREVGRSPRRHAVEAMETREMAPLASLYGRPRFAVPVMAPLDGPEVDLPVDPYTLGVWLGDGHTNQGRVTSADREVIERLPYEVSKVYGGITYTLLGLQADLRSAGVLGAKHIPPIYLRASEKQRMELLRGLMDTDGSCSAGQCEFTGMNFRLNGDVEELIRSLGFKVRAYGGRAMLNGVDHGPKYRLSFYPRPDRPVFHLARKAERQIAGNERSAARDAWETITSIEPVPTHTTRCLQVDAADSLFVAGRNWKVTHNTTLLEDWCTYKLATDPSFRIMVASETVDHGKKVLGRVQGRLETDGPVPQLVNDFGPFAPVDGRSSQPWGATHFDVAGKKQSDERDYSMNCVGLTGRVQGTRADLLLLDDVQDVKSLEQSQKYYDIIVQSFLSRPEMSGRTVIIGTRVGEWDVYRLLLDAEIPDQLVTIPAYNVVESPAWPKPAVKPDKNDPETWAPEGVKFLWPEKYGGDRLARLAYAKLRHRIGEKAWARNYMQRPEAAADMTFSEEVTELLKEDFRSVIADVEPVHNEDGTTNQCPVVLSLDPAVGGGNGLLAAGMYPDRMDVFNARLDSGLTDYGQIFALLEDWLWLYTTDTSKVEEVVIEDKAFQKGLLRDDRLVELQRKFGFRTVPNTTGREKSDPDIGIPAMPMSIRRAEVTIPWADEQSRKAMQPLLDHLHQWRPGVRGNQLPMDMVMALWFAWRRWRGYRNTPAHHRPEANQFRSAKCSPFRQRQAVRRTYGGRVA